MSTYEYICQDTDCKHEWEEEQRMSDPVLTVCVLCGQETAKRLISKSSFILNGGCWAKDSYSK